MSPPLVAGPYRSGTNDDPVLIAKNVEAMTNVSLLSLEEMPSFMTSA